jgi:hypothetical protein
LAGVQFKGGDRFPGGEAKQDEVAPVPAYFFTSVRVDRREHRFKMVLLHASRRRILSSDL